MHATVHPRYTLFEKTLLGILYLLELPFHLLNGFAARSRRRFDKIFLDDLKSER